MSEIVAKIVLPLKNLKANIFNRCVFASFQYWRMTVNPEHSDFDINAPEILITESAPEIFGQVVIYISTSRVHQRSIPGESTSRMHVQIYF